MPQKKIGESSMMSCVSMHNGMLTSGVLGTSNVHCDLISTNSFKLNVDFKTSSIPSLWVSYFFFILYRGTQLCPCTCWALSKRASGTIFIVFAGIEPATSHTQSSVNGGHYDIRWQVQKVYLDKNWIEWLSDLRRSIHVICTCT